MNLVCQSAAIEELSALSLTRSRSVMIAGPAGSGKTYLTKVYSDMLKVPDFQMIPASVGSIREAVEETMQLKNEMVLCIENLDTGTSAAASAILKLLEEPKSTIYIVVTVRNIHNIADTIISRSCVVNVQSPTPSDLDNYAKQAAPEKYRMYQTCEFAACLKTFNDIDTFYTLDKEAIAYIQGIPNKVYTSKCILDAVWALQYLPGGGSVPTEVAIRYMIMKDTRLLWIGNEALKQLALRRISSNAILSKFIFEYRTIT